MPIEFAVDWDKVHEVIDWANSIGWALLLAYEFRRIRRKDADNKGVLQPIQATERVSKTEK